MTDNEIKKALECCGTRTCISNNCPYGGVEDISKCTTKLAKNALDLINRQEFRIHQQEKTIMEIQNANLIDFKRTIANYKADNESLKAKIERLKKALENQQKISMDRYFEVKELKSAINGFRGYEDKIKAEAYKEFAERLKEYATQGFWETDAYVGAEQIDNLLNELVGEDNESKA